MRTQCTHCILYVYLPWVICDLIYHRSFDKHSYCNATDIEENCLPGITLVFYDYDSLIKPLFYRNVKKQCNG